MTGRGWQDLAKAVKQRRATEGQLSQRAVAKRGGPSTETLRLIESAMLKTIRPATLAKLDKALNWPEGTSQQVLDGTATADDLARKRGFRMPQGSGISVGEMLVSTPPGKGLDIFGPEQRRAVEAMRGGVASAILASAGRPVFNTAFGAAFGAWTESLQSMVQGFNSRLGADLAQRMADVTNTQFGKIASAMQPVDLTAALGLQNWTAKAIPPMAISRELAAMWAEFDRIDHLIDIEAQPWFEGPDMQVRDVVRLYHEHQAEHPTDKGPELEPASEPGDSERVLSLVPNAEATEEDDEPVEVLLGPWGVVFEAQQAVGDVDDLALASEMLARMSRRPPNDDRNTLIGQLTRLIGDLVKEQGQIDAPRSRPAVPSASHHGGSGG